MSFRKSLLAACLLLSGGVSQAALIEMFNTNLGGTALDSIAEAEAIIAASGGPDFVTNSNTINYSGDGFPGDDFGLPPNDRFVMRVTGLIDTDAYDQLFMQHDDGFVIRIGGGDFFLFDANTAPIISSSGALADNGIQTFEMIFWDQGGAQVARLAAGLTPDFTIDPNRLVTVTDPVARVPEPGTIALLGLGLLGIGIRQRRRKI